MKNAGPATLFRLDKKVVFITGAGSGIGASMAGAFASAGAMVILADRDSESVSRRAEEVGGRALALDVTSDDDCKQTAARVREEFGVPDVVINNAGVGAVGNLVTATSDDLDRMYAVNVKGVFQVSKAFLPGMLERGSGNFINLASIGGIVGIRDRVAYCTTKFAVVGLTKSMALDHAADGIRVNCICPGRVETPFVQARIAEYPDPEEARREMSSTQLLGRMIQPDEVASAALYLAADESYMITGTTFLIDGGWSVGR